MKEMFIVMVADVHVEAHILPEVCMNYKKANDAF